MDIDTETSWYIYGNQNMAARTILKAVSVWRLMASSSIHCIWRKRVDYSNKKTLQPLPPQNPLKSDKI